MGCPKAAHSSGFQRIPHSRPSAPWSCPSAVGLSAAPAYGGCAIARGQQVEKSRFQAGGNEMRFCLYKTINHLLDFSSLKICEAEGKDVADKGRLEGLRLLLPEGKDDS